jgi:tetratricopeptide (TPR) repeat protein
VISQTKIEEKEGYIYIKEGDSQVQLAMPEEMKDADAYIIKLNKLTDTKSINADILNRSKKMGLFKKNKDDLKKGLLTETIKIELIKKSNEGTINKDELKLLNQLKEEKSNKNNLEVLKNLAVESYLKKANDAYNQKNYKKALHYSELANQLDSKNYRIKAMIGSLQYRLGNDKLAKKYWTNSLKFNPNQPNIKLYLRKIK